MNVSNESDHWQTRMQNTAEAVAFTHGDEELADILFVVGKNKEVS